MQSHRFSLPDQEHFENLTVVPTGAGQQQFSKWECSKRAKTSSVRTLPSTCEDSEQCAHTIELPSTTETSLTPSDKENDDDFTVVIFVLGGMTVRDPSQPMPPPSRYVRSRK